jgi:hypothetical protein
MSADVVPLRPVPATTTLEAELAKLAATCRETGKLEYQVRLLNMGTVFVVSREVGMHELLSALELAGLTFSTVDDVQLIHHLPRSERD